MVNIANQSTITPLGDICKVDWGNTDLTKRAYVVDGAYLGVNAAGIDGKMSNYEHVPELNIT